MSTYICEKCGCIDNTSCGGNYWGVMGKQDYYKDDYTNNHVLCVECTPKEFDDGSIDDKAGKWHNKFTKKHWSDYGTKEELIKISKKNYGDFINAIEYFQSESFTEEIRENVRQIELLQNKFPKCNNKRVNKIVKKYKEQINNNTKGR